MRTSRRSMIRLGLYAAASFALFEGISGEALAAVTNAVEPMDDGAWLRRDMFEALVGETFVVSRPGSKSIQVRLTRVEDVLSARNAGTVNHQDCFAVLFRGSRPPYLVQGTYRIENATLGGFEVFLVPGAVSSTGITYTATFNRVPA